MKQSLTVYTYEIKWISAVRVSNILATVGELTTTPACVVTPYREWLQVDISVVSGVETHVIGRLNYNQSFETPSSLNRFNTSIQMNGATVDVMLTLNLTDPSDDICSWDNRYTVYCSVLMNDTSRTKISDFNRISVTGKWSLKGNTHAFNWNLCLY
jgi:hypothetical protein